MIIKNIKAYVIDAPGLGGDYHNQKEEHWIVKKISNPMSKYEKYRDKRTSWGIDVLKSILVEIELENGIKGYSTGFGGEPATYIIEKHFKRFVVNEDVRNINKMWDMMFRSSMYYGRKGLPLAAISVVDIALWDCLGKLRNEPVYNLIGGKTKESIPLYCTGIDAVQYKKDGFFGAKIPLKYSPSEGNAGLRKNVAEFKKIREKVGPDFPIMIDCYMSLNVSYAIALAKALEPYDIEWMEECLHPDDFDGQRKLKEAVPTMKWTTGEHEYSRYGFRKLIEGRYVDIIQPDIMWLGGLSESLKVSAMAGAYDIPVVPHGSGAYSYHFVISQENIPFCEYINNSPKGDKIVPVFGSLFKNEPEIINGHVTLDDSPGFGLDLNVDLNDLKRPYKD